MSERAISAVVFDWAGTTVDYGCRAPALVFQEIFSRCGVPITVEQARGPMGATKRDHIAQILEMPEVRDRWLEAHGETPGEQDVDRLYEQFLPLQKETLRAHTDLIPGTLETCQWLTARGILIGSTTGYTRELMDIVAPAAAQQGYQPHAIVCGDEVHQGRPAPWMFLEALHRLNAYPAWTCVKVDDTPVGIRAGKNAGAWTVAVAKTGNQLGLSPEEIAALDPDDLDERLESICTDFAEQGADYIIDGIEELPETLEKIAHRAGSGQLPSM